MKVVQNNIWFLTVLSFLCIIKMINLDDITNENQERNEKWSYIPDHPDRTLIIGGSGSGKANALLNLINKQNDNGKIHLYQKI